MKVLYIAGNFTPGISSKDHYHDHERNILTASRYALSAWKRGWAVICPHKNTSGFQHVVDVPPNIWYNGTMELLKRCDAILMLPGWEMSVGSTMEFEYVRECREDMPILIATNDPDDIPSPKEVKWT